MENSIERIRDEWLVLRAQSGDRLALEELVSRWHPRLVRHAGRVIGRQDVAADVVQEAWLAIMRGLSRLEDPACFPRWAYQIVTRRGVDWIRHASRERRVMRTVVNSVPVAEATGGPSSEIDELRHAIRQLPTARRTLLAMHYLDGLAIAEIAEALSIPAGTVKSRLFHTRRELKDILERAAR